MVQVPKDVLAEPVPPVDPVKTVTTDIPVLLADQVCVAALVNLAFQAETARQVLATGVHEAPRAVPVATTSTLSIQRIYVSR